MTAWYFATDLHGMGHGSNQMEKKRNQHELQSSRRLYLKRAGGIDKNAFAKNALPEQEAQKEDM